MCGDNLVLDRRVRPSVAHHAVERRGMIKFTQRGMRESLMAPLEN